MKARICFVLIWFLDRPGNVISYFTSIAYAIIGFYIFIVNFFPHIFTPPLFYIQVEVYKGKFNNVLQN